MLFEKLERNLVIGQQQVLVQSLYVLSCIASGSQKHKKITLEDRFFNRALQHLKSTEFGNVKIAVLNLIINLAHKECESQTDGKARKAIIDLNLTDMLVQMREKEREPEVKSFFDRAIKKIG